jgi:hypothetical protein
LEPLSLFKGGGRAVDLEMECEENRPSKSEGFGTPLAMSGRSLSLQSHLQ